MSKSAVHNINVKLMTAWDQLKDETCPKCGLQIWICRSTDRYLQFTVGTTTCFASAMLEQEAAKKDSSKEFGVQKFAKPEMILDKPLPSRTDYLEEARAVWEYEQKQKEASQ